MIYLTFDFKILYTTKTVSITFDNELSICQFINKTLQICSEQLLIDNYNYEIVEAGQYDNINSPYPELAPPIISSQKSLKDVYNNFREFSFYLRPVMQ
jgi:hypothetical protein